MHTTFRAICCKVAEYARIGVQKNGGAYFAQIVASCRLDQVLSTGNVTVPGVESTRVDNFAEPSLALKPHQLSPYLYLYLFIFWYIFDLT
jgi:hypothetical protein